LKLIVLAAVVFIAIGGVELDYWPMIGWGMYRDRDEPFLAEEKHAYQLRVIDHRGTVHRLWGKDVWLLDRDAIVFWIMRDSVRTDKNEYWLAKRPRSALIELVRIKRPDIEPRRMEVWSMTWHPDALKIPPLDPMKPDKQVLLGAFETDGLTTIDTEPGK
jgi:hypothetical protein